MNTSFAKINGLPIKERLINNNSNSNINDIITLKVNNIPIFCKIVGYTQTRMINVIELEPLITDINISFIAKYKDKELEEEDINKIMKYYSKILTNDNKYDTNFESHDQLAS